MLVDASGAEEKAAKICDLIANTAAAAMQASVPYACTDAAMAVTPTVDEEYGMLMSVDGNPAVPRAGNRSDDQDGRIRLIKDESTYLENVVPSRANWDVDGNGILGIGNRKLLEAVTQYQYVNLQRTGAHTHVQSEPHTVGPYWNEINFGAFKAILPIFTLLNGHKYRLRPVDNNEDKGLDVMFKSFPGADIFNPIRLGRAAFKALKTALNELKGA